MERIIIQNQENELSEKDGVLEYSIEVPRQRWEEIKQDIAKIEEIQQKINKMEEKMDSQPKASSVNRIVGKVSLEKKQKILLKMESIFGEQALKEGEQVKTQEELKIIEIANEATNKILEKYDIECFDVPPENIHKIEDEYWKGKDTSMGNFKQEQQSINLRERNSSLSSILMRTFHELLHFKSDSALQVLDETGYIFQYRLGFRLVSRDGKKNFFHNLNEAVTESMTQKYAKSLLDNQMFEDEQRLRKEILSKAKLPYSQGLSETYRFYTKNELHELNSLKITTNKKTEEKFFLETFAYPKERKALKTLIDKLFIKNPNKFENEEEIMEMFEKAMLSGNILPIGKLIDTTFDKGTFRKIGELGEDTKGFSEFIESL